MVRRAIWTTKALGFALLLQTVAPRRIPPSWVTPQTETSAHRRLTGDEPRSRALDIDTPSSPEEHLVENLPLLAEGELSSPHWAGHLPASPDGDKYFFYWLFAPEGNFDPENVPIVIWLNGGPGCSSMDGLFLENGPLRLVKTKNGDFEMKADANSWHKAPAYTLYIDQPVGTGLSFTTSKKYPKNDEEVNVDFYHFLQAFYKLHSDKFVKGAVARNPLFFSGESHAGHYIPHMMNYILKQNEKLNPGDFEVNLAGAAIGNGWTDPYYQYAAAKAAFGHAVIGHAQMLALDQKETICQSKLAKGEYVVNECFDLLDDIIHDSQGSSTGYKQSMYDIRKTERSSGSREFPPGHKEVETYLGGHALEPKRGTMPSSLFQEVLKSIHATAADSAGQRFSECTDPPYNALKHQDGKGVIEDLVKVLEHPDHIRILFFNGVEDMICNHVGNEIFLENMKWKHQTDWIKAKRFAWRAKTEEATKVSGYSKQFHNLHFLKLLNSGHMAPMDVPDVAFDMIRVFVNGGDFSTSEQRLSRSSEDSSCPKCEACPAVPSQLPIVNSTDLPTLPQSKAGDSGYIVISSSTAFAILGVSSFIALVLVLQLRRRKSRIRHAVVPQCETELSGQYQDRPDPIGDEAFVACCIYLWKYIRAKQTSLGHPCIEDEYHKKNLMVSYHDHLRRMAADAVQKSRHSTNTTITSTVVIRVTPREDHVVSWGILLGCFLLASMVGLWQVWKEYKLLSGRKQTSDGADHQADEISTADITRSHSAKKFRRLLLVAMISRIIMMPVQIWTDALIWQFIGDTFPELIFTSAWTLLVGFFAQLVGIATGGVTATTPGAGLFVIAMLVYAILVILQLQNSVASVLMYSLLCCVDAVLLGTTVYFIPRLLTVLKPSLEQHQGVVVRLVTCAAVCTGLFGAHVFTTARRVINPPNKVYWWWHYGVLELFPSVVFLSIINPGSKKGSPHPGRENVKRKTIKRSDSASSSTSNLRRSGETAGLLLKSAPTYGGTSRAGMPKVGSDSNLVV